MNSNLIKKIFLSSIINVLMFGTVVTTNVHADTNYTITINNTESGHTYEAYQIFEGDLSTDSKTLSNIEWGDGVQETDKLLEELRASLSEYFSDKTQTPRQVAVILDDLGKDFGEDNDKLKTFAEIVSKHLSSTSAVSLPAEDDDNYNITVEEPGYYFIKDKDKSLEDSYTAYTRYMLKVVGNITVSPKSEKPTVDKSLSGTEDVNCGDYAINEKFSYYLTATLPANPEYSEYEKYKLIFEDTMGEGITYDEIESATIMNNDGSYTADIKDQVKVEQTPNLTFTIEDLIGIINGKTDITKGVKVVVKYTAHLNEKADTSKPDTTDNPNVNTVKLKYSNNPNDGTTDDMGTTVGDKNYVFTYGVDNTKYEKYANESDNRGVLEGAGFRLYDSTGENEIKLKWDDERSAYCPVTDEDDAGEMMLSHEDGKFNIVGLDAGTYILKEKKTPDGYNTCDPITIEIETTFENSGDSATVNFTKSENMSNNIINVHGSKLPSTGSVTLIITCGVAIALGVGGLALSRNKKEE